MSYLKQNISKEYKKTIAAECFDIQEKLNTGSISHSMGICGNARGFILYYSFKNYYPFDGKGVYYQELRDRSLYKNKKRLAFIKRWAGYHEKGKYSK